MSEIVHELKTEQPLVKLVSRGEFSGRNLIEALIRDAGALEPSDAVNQTLGKPR